jgi:hypothetical protein
MSSQNLSVPSQIASMIKFYFNTTVPIVKNFPERPVNFIPIFRQHDPSFYTMRQLVREINSRNYDFISDDIKLRASEFGNLIEFVADATAECILEEPKILESIREIKNIASNRHLCDYQWGEYQIAIERLRYRLQKLYEKIQIRQNKYKREVAKRYGDFEKYLKQKEIEYETEYWHNYVVMRALEKRLQDSQKCM